MIYLVIFMNIDGPWNIDGILHNGKLEPKNTKHRFNCVGNLSVYLYLYVYTISIICTFFICMYIQCWSAGHRWNPRLNSGCAEQLLQPLPLTFFSKPGPVELTVLQLQFSIRIVKLHHVLCLITSVYIYIYVLWYML